MPWLTARREEAVIEEAAKRGKTNTFCRRWKPSAGLASEREQAAGTLATLKAERASLTAQAAGSRSRPYLSGTWRSLSTLTPIRSGRSGG
jgi:hypothetical protein